MAQSLENEIAHNEILIREREAEVLNIEADVHDLASLFKDLQHMVNDQGASFDLIEDNVVRTAIHIEKGNSNLTKANKSDKRGRFLICLILFVVLFIGLAVLIFVVGLLIPFSNLMFKKYDHLLGKINTLSYRVDEGSAKLSLLRMQINPHFLFNAINSVFVLIRFNPELASDTLIKLSNLLRSQLYDFSA